MKEDVLYQGEWLTVRAMRLSNGRSPAADWFNALDDRGTALFLAACKVLENSYRSGRSPAGRAEKVGSSRNPLLELKVTKPGSTPPHHRALCIRRQNVLWVANGFTKQTNRLDPRDIAKGDSTVDAWNEPGIDNGTARSR